MSHLQWFIYISTIYFAPDRLLVLDMMERRHQTSFKDIAMLNQATQFLHENGKICRISTHRITFINIIFGHTCDFQLIVLKFYPCTFAGMLLHYDDVNLQDLYFLDPQWLCDILANIVTIREINSLAKSGNLL